MTQLGPIMIFMETNLGAQPIGYHNQLSKQMKELLQKVLNGSRSTYQAMVGESIGPLRIWLKFLKILNQENMFCHSVGIVNRVLKFGILVLILQLSKQCGKIFGLVIAPTMKYKTAA